MKLESPSRFTSFYESFSDLIFGTMAIFVLLMLVFLALVQPPPNQGQELKEAQEQLESLQSELQKSEFEKEKAREQLEEMLKAMAESEDSIQSKGLELIVAFDVSGSMDDALGHLVETIKTISIRAGNAEKRGQRLLAVECGNSRCGDCQSLEPRKPDSQSPRRPEPQRGPNGHDYRAYGEPACPGRRHV